VPTNPVVSLSNHGKGMGPSFDRIRTKWMEAARPAQ